MIFLNVYFMRLEKFCNWWRRLNIRSFREDNRGVDLMAKKDEKNSQFSSFVELPREMRGIVNIDRSGVQNLR